jgi:hypothetical protein
MNKTLTGIFIGLIVSGLIIYSFNHGYNFLEVIVGFIVFFFPTVFLSSFQSRTASLILTVVWTLFIYICYHFVFYHTWPGVLIAFIIGLPIYFLKIRNNDAAN